MSQRNPDDPYNLLRFVEAQASVFDQACSELRAGRKRSHWMWFVFPQIRGLGSSALAVEYAISSRNEAAAYLEHPLLGRRLRECSQMVVGIEGRSIDQIFGYPDDLKFLSSMTLFAHAAPEDASRDDRIFKVAVDKYFSGKWDQGTLDRL